MIFHFTLKFFELFHREYDSPFQVGVREEREGREEEKERGRRPPSLSNWD